MDQAFNRIWQLHKEAKFYHTGNHGIVLFPNIVFHVFCLLHGFYFALRINSPAFPTRGLAGNVWKNLFEMLCHFLGFSIFAHHSMNHQVRITTDGTGKVSIILSSKPIVAMVVLWVTGLLHRAQQHHRENVCIRFSFDLAHNFLQGFLAHLTSRSVDLDPKARSIIDKLLYFFCFRIFVDPVDERQLQSRKVFRYRFIGNQHKGFNHPLGNPSLTQNDINWFSFFIDQDFSLIGIKIEGSSANPHTF